MKSPIAILMLFVGMLASAQTPVTPTINNGQVQVTVPDSSGGSHVVTFPLTAVTSLTVGLGYDTYTAPPPPPPPPPSGPSIPASAIAVDLIKPATPWKACVHDAGTPGTGSCSNNYPVTGITTDNARAFSMAYGGSGGVRWAISFAKDTTSTNFVYDTQVISADWTHTANLELDTNQVKANGKTAILGTQCSSYSHSWEYTLNTAANTGWHWVSSKLPCDPTKWTPNVLHHIRIFGTIDASGVSTYTGVEFDGSYSAFSGATGSTANALGWGAGSVLTNFQIDGLGLSGSATIYADRLTIYRW